MIIQYPPSQSCSRRRMLQSALLSCHTRPAQSLQPCLSFVGNMDMHEGMLFGNMFEQLVR